MTSTVDLYTHAATAPSAPAAHGLRKTARGLHQADTTFSTWRPASAMSRLRRGEIALSQCPAQLVAVLRLRC